MFQSVKDKSAKNRQETYKTGGGPNCSFALTKVEEKVNEMMAPLINGLDDHHGPDNVTEGKTIFVLFQRSYSFYFLTTLLIIS